MNRLLWQAQSNIISAAALLFLCRVVYIPLCFLCGEAVEFGLHALRDCKWVNKVWQLLLKEAVQVHFFQAISVAEGIDKNLMEQFSEQDAELEQRYVFLEAVYSI